ncbi:hypothetical protein ACFVJ5_28140 [Nocardia sp. NPDC127606]|uniref:hypothetical protein n=1 Tax=Nocardia sp. NPDC127606 TaxID=3345406 RepID=UPI00362EF2C1
MRSQRVWRNGPAGHDDRGPDHHAAAGDDDADNSTADHHHRSGDGPGNHVQPAGSSPGVIGSTATRDRADG